MNTDVKVIAVIPARGGSKRFPGKNLHPLNGKPLIAHPIEAAKKASRIDRIIVSTDDEEIAAIAREYGAEVPFMRPADIAGDKSPVIEAVEFTLKELERMEGYVADYCVLLQPTTPLIEAEQIDQAISLAVEKHADSVVTVAEVETINHPYNVREILPDGTIRFWQYDLHYEVLGKDRPKFYHAANLWLSSRQTILSEGKLEGKMNYPIIVPSQYSVDIDFKEDLDRIEVWLESRKRAEDLGIS